MNKENVDQSYRKLTYTTMKNSPFLSPPHTCQSLVKLPNVIVLVGLPARGKTFISKKLCRYLNWIGIRTNCKAYWTEVSAFNLGDYRRYLTKRKDSNFFLPNNPDGVNVRTECARMAMDHMIKFLNDEGGEVAIFDATNTTRERREFVMQRCTKDNVFRVFFIESVCDDQNVIEANIEDVKVSSPDYIGMDREEAKNDFIRRIHAYTVMYEPLDEVYDDALSFIKIINAGKSFFVHNVQGHVQSRVVYFLMNVHLMPRSIFLSRVRIHDSEHGESEYNLMGRLGGDPPVSTSGTAYARELVRYFENQKVQDLRVWSSQKIRAVQTASGLKGVAAYIEYWKALDEIDAGICEGLTYEEIAERYPQQLANRDKDKYHYRYPSGESYEDLVARLEPVIMELERQSNVLVISHQAVLRCVLAYFLDKDQDNLPYLRVPLHSVVKLQPIAYGCKMDVINFDVNAVNTHRDKPPWSVISLAKPDMERCHSPDTQGMFTVGGDR